ncbi:MAG: DUF1566 domain-containing protein [Deltaproteobacteria bacterium]|nr:DUF1566 domain-containing protein [Deltaproteobacteria bacterium]
MRMVLLVVAALCACPTGRFLCNADGDCPSGQTCTGGTCATPENLCDVAPCVDCQAARWPMPGDRVRASQFQLREHTVYDPARGLEWERATEAAHFTHAQAVERCRCLPLAGRHDWRLPTRIELVTLVDHGSTMPAIDQDAFPGGGGRRWTASPDTDPAFAWAVDFDSGAVSGAQRVTGLPVRCVRGSTP